jgi:hypothetical protein
MQNRCVYKRTSCIRHVILESYSVKMDYCPSKKMPPYGKRNSLNTGKYRRRTYPLRLRLDLVLFLLVNSIPVGVNGLTLAAGGVSKLSLLSMKDKIQLVSIGNL